MRKIKVGIIALAASATILAPAGSVAATTQSASSPTTTTEAAVCALLCFDLYEDGLRVGHDVDALTAVKFCWGGVLPPLPIETVAIDQKIECYPYQGHKRWIIRSK
jgi:hypothetical protein